MGRLTNLNPPAPITDADLPASMTRDSELAAALAAAIAAHVAAADPHPPYLDLLEGDLRYEYRRIRASKSLLGPLSFPTNAWTSLGTIAGFSLGTQGEPSAIVIGLNFLSDVQYPWQQSVCAGLIGAIWWQPVLTNDAGIRVPLEIHNQSGIYINIRISQGNGIPNSNQGSGSNRYIEIKPEAVITIPSNGRVDLVLMKLL